MSTAAAIADAALAVPARLGSVRLVVLDGPSGSGKSTLADALVAELGPRGVRTGLVRTDHFATWDDPVGWWPRLERGVLEPVAAGRPGRYLPTSWGRPVLPVPVPVPDVLVLEGVSSARRRVEHVVSLAVWVELASSTARLERAVARDGERERAHLRRWQRVEQGWFAVDATRRRAHVVVAET
ncbi:(d)CMP kinase [Rhodococcus antarcticus]|uniref:(D)CMP kinase n=1 Tax=Rhodococcus antarcticus TaxID=2987751 RepID=A0ABY6P022_9NOCA|nr:(d)CMP kinase [Rhodococcus antarcticus]UZJ24503.1 (d)CMP kinase [Rhodococcus antarcticus]